MLVFVSLATLALLALRKITKYLDNAELLAFVSAANYNGIYIT